MMDDSRVLEGMRPCTHFAGARAGGAPVDRQKAIIRGAAAFREEAMAQEPVPYYQSFPLVRVPYPTRFAYRNAFTLPTPMMHILNRMFVVQFYVGEDRKTLLVSPSDTEANAATPFFNELANKMGRLKDVGRHLIAPVLGTVEGHLESVGIAPEDVDYITYDHLHTQDLRRWFGDGESRGFFPNAKLLVMRQEWESVQGLLPPQAYWYCPNGVSGIPAERVIELNGDMELGRGVYLIRTPGHTEGNHSIVVRTPEGLMVTSENGVGPDSYAPLASDIPGLREFAKRTGEEVVLNGNTLEGGLDQYLSMIQEKEMAGPSARHPDFPNIVSSSEATPYWAFPGIRPTFSFGDLCFGTPQKSFSLHP